MYEENESVELGDKTHHLIFNAAAYESEDDSEIKDFLSFVKKNKAESDFTRGIANMVQTKKFEQSFVNEYLAWNLHDKDVKKQGIIEGVKETARNALAMGLTIAQVSQMTGLSLSEIEKLKS